MTKRSTVWLLVGAFGAVTAAALAHVSLRIGTVQLGYAIGDARTERRALEEQRRKLTTELTMLKNPARLRALAETQLGMTAPDPGRIRTVRPGTTEVAANGAPRLGDVP
jgi:cell division protein FtsL